MLEVKDDYCIGQATMALISLSKMVYQTLIFDYYGVYVSKQPVSLLVKKSFEIADDVLSHSSIEVICGVLLSSSKSSHLMYIFPEHVKYISYLREPIVTFHNSMTLRLNTAGQMDQAQKWVDDRRKMAVGEGY